MVHDPHRSAGRKVSTSIAKPNLRSAPEGPYEGEDPHWQVGITRSESSRFIDFVEELENETDSTLPLKGGYREMRIFIHLLRHHLSGRLVTASSLADASSLSYGTAMRALDDLVKRGLIIKRPRTVSGKSFSLHPSAGLLDQWQKFEQRVKSMLDSKFARENIEEPTAYDINGGVPAASRVVPPPAALEKKLNLTRGLRILVHADPTFVAMNSLRKQFEMIFGVEIRSRALSIDRLRAEIIDNSLAKSSRYDIIACDLPWFGEMASAGRLLALDPLIDENEFDRRDFHADALASACYWGVQYGIPILTTAEILVYRTDLFAGAGIAPPTTAAETLSAVRALHRPAAGLSGIAWNGGRGTPLGHTFIMVMGAFGQPVVNLRRLPNGFDAENVSGEQMRPMFMSDAARDTAEYLRELVQYSPPNILRMTWYDRAMAYAQGKVASAYSHSLLAQLYELNESSPAYRMTGYLPHPAGPQGAPIVPLGGYALAIPANIERERIGPVWTALRTLTSPSAAKLYAANGSLAWSRFSIIRDQEIRSISPMIPAVDQMARRSLLRMWPRPPIAGISDVIGIAGQEIHDMLSGLKSINQALSNAQNRSDAVMQQHGHY